MCVPLSDTDLKIILNYSHCSSKRKYVTTSFHFRLYFSAPKTQIMLYSCLECQDQFRSHIFRFLMQLKGIKLLGGSNFRGFCFTCADLSDTQKYFPQTIQKKNLKIITLLYLFSCIFLIPKEYHSEVDYYENQEDENKKIS